MINISVIIPTYNRSLLLQGCLKSLSRLNYPPENFEVIVVDDGSTVTPEDVVELFQDKLKIRLFHIEHSGPGAARNKGAENAQGKFLAFIDDDCTPRADWLDKLESHLEKNPDCMVGGRTFNHLTGNPYSTASQVIIDAAYTFFNMNPDDARFFASNNFAVRSELFLDIGGFDESFRIASEDRDLCDRWMQSGRKMIYASEAAVYHSNPLTFFSFCVQHFNYGIGAFHYRQACEKRKSDRVKDDMSFYTNLFYLLRKPFSKLLFNMKIRVCILLIVWQIVYMWGFFYGRFKIRNID